jgi:hypothetical protein
VANTKAGAKSATAKVETPADPFVALPEAVQAAVAVVPTPQNAREAAGTHLNPRMGRLLRAFRGMNGNISQVKLAKGELTGSDVTTTHCQIATLEQGGCKKGADPYTVKLLAKALNVDETVITAINEADLRDRHEAGDKLAGKILGVAEEAGVTPEEVAAETPDAATSEADVPEPAQL